MWHMAWEEKCSLELTTPRLLSNTSSRTHDLNSYEISGAAFYQDKNTIWKGETEFKKRGFLLKIVKLTIVLSKRYTEDKNITKNDTIAIKETNSENETI